MRDSLAILLPEPQDLPAIDELPDPFLRPDGTRIRTRREWRAQRDLLLRRVLHYEYGALPSPAVVTGEMLRARPLRGLRATEHAVRLRIGTDRPLAVRLILTRPDGAGPFPVIVRGDLGWRRTRREIVATVVQRGYALADFDRTAVAADAAKETGIYRMQPGYDGGRIAAWAWGFQRVVDYLETLPFIDRTRIAVTGHSRGGKAALLAGAIDPRIALTAPNNSGCGGAGCFRIAGRGSEDVRAITTTFPYWFHARFAQFAGTRVRRLPFDQHTVKALVAPRALFSTEALGDAWANPRGTQASHRAAKEVFAFLGAADRIGIRFRDGGHEHNARDWEALLDFADWQFFGRNVFDRPAFVPEPSGYVWRAP
jgi:dienelactone hydrolase